MPSSRRHDLGYGWTKNTEASSAQPNPSGATMAATTPPLPNGTATLRMAAVLSLLCSTSQCDESSTALLINAGYTYPRNLVQAPDKTSNSSRTSAVEIWFGYVRKGPQPARLLSVWKYLCLFIVREAGEYPSDYIHSCINSRLLQIAWQPPDLYSNPVQSPVRSCRRHTFGFTRVHFTATRSTTESMWRTLDSSIYSARGLCSAKADERDHSGPHVTVCFDQNVEQEQCRTQTIVETSDPEWNGPLEVKQKKYVQPIVKGREVSRRRLHFVGMMAVLARVWCFLR